MLRLAHLAGCLAACMCPPGMTAWAVPRGLPHAQAGAHRPALGGGSSSSRAVVWPWLPRQCWRLTAHSGGLWGWPLGLASWCHAPRVTVKAMCLMRWLCVVPEGAVAELWGRSLQVSSLSQDPGGDKCLPGWKPRPAPNSSASRPQPGHPVTSLELAPAWKVAFLPGSVSIYRGHGPQRGQILAPDHTESGQPVKL